MPHPSEMTSTRPGRSGTSISLDQQTSEIVTGRHDRHREVTPPRGRGTVRAGCESRSLLHKGRRQASGFGSRGRSLAVGAEIKSHIDGWATYAPIKSAGFTKALARDQSLTRLSYVTYCDRMDLEEAVDDAATALIPVLEAITDNLEILEELQRSRRAYSRRVAAGEAGGGKADLEVPPPPLAACTGTDLDFLTDHNGFEIGLKAKRANFTQQLALCEGCRFKDDCLARASTPRTLIGIWGGTMPAERSKAWRARSNA